METTDWFGNTPLHRVIEDKKLSQNEMIESLKRLLDKQINVNAENSHGQTALHLAILTRMQDVADFLIGRKANFGKIAHFFIDDEYRKFRDLLKQNRRFSSLYPPDRIQQKEIESASFVEWLISKGLDFDCKNEKNECAVYKAIERGLQHILPALLKSAKDISFVDNEKRTALHLFFYRNTEIVKGHVNIFWEWYSQRYALDVVSILLDRGVRVEAEDTYGHSHIDAALITRQKISVIEILVKRCAIIGNNSERHGNYTLTVMIKAYKLSDWKTEDFLRILRCMIAKGLVINQLREPTDSYGETLLCYAIEKWSMPVIDFLCEHNADNFNVCTKNGQTLLHLFASSNCREIDNNGSMKFLDLLISRGCLVNAKDNSGKTPLHAAVEREKIDIVQKLIEYGAEVNCRTNDGVTPLQIAVAGTKNLPLIEFLAKCGADFNVTTKDGENFLHLLFRNRYLRDENLELFDLLIQKGCQVNAKDVKGTMPLHHAVKSNKELFVCKLIEEGAEINCVTENGMTPLLIAAEGRYSVGLVDLLLKKRADPSIITKNKQSLLHLLAKGFFTKDDMNTVTEHFSVFIKKGCQINAKDIFGMTPLHEAAFAGNVIVAQKLIEYGANINCRNNKKETPFHLAVKNSCSEDNEIIQLLLKYEINVNAKDSEGQTALHLAALKSRRYPHDNESLLWMLLTHGADVNVQDKKSRSAFRCAFDRDPDDDEIDDYPGRCWSSSESSNGGGEDFDEEMWAEEKYACDEAIFLMDHSIVLKAANLPWDKKINKLLENPSMIAREDSTRKKYYRECLEEIKTLKTNFVDDHISLYDLLHIDLNRRWIYLNNKKWQEIVHSKKLRKQFPKYLVLILANHNEAVIRKSLLEPAKEAWIKMTKMNWPDLCSEHIFSFLSNSDLFNIIEKD